jgi:hypothetical protein
MKSVWGETYEGCCQEIRVYEPYKCFINATQHMRLKSVMSDAEVRGAKDSANLIGVGAFTKRKKFKKYNGYAGDTLAKT